jgi:hypothetical protein
MMARGHAGERGEAVPLSGIALIFSPFKTPFGQKYFFFIGTGFNFM